MKVLRNQLFLPLNFEVLIDENDPVRKLTEICDTLDYTKLYDVYLRRWRSIDPAIMFEILVFANMNCIYSSRDIEQACKTDIRFMWLLQGEPAPDHSTFARFQNEKLVGVIEDLFYQLILKLHELGEIEFNNIFIDGTKIEANANRYTFVWAKTVEKNLQKLNAKINDELPDLCQKYGLSESASLADVIEFLLKARDFLGIKFVYGRGKHKTDIQRDYDRIYEYLERIDRYHESQTILGTRKSYSKTDLDATFMRMKEDHMRKGQLKPAYNVQIGVESEYIVGVGLFSNPTDTTTLIPFLERLQKNIGRKYLNIIADAGYASEENYTYLEENDQNAYIEPANYEIKKTRKYKSNIYRVENLSYDEIGDYFTCPNGKRLNHAYDSKSKTKNDYEIIKSYYIPSSVETLGEHAFEGVEKLNVEAISKNVANGAINSGAKQLVLNISANSVAMKDAEFNVSKDVDSFELRGNANEFENIKLKSEAKTTVLNGLKIISTNGTPLQIYSENITFNRLTVESSGFAALLTYPDTKLSLYGSVNMNSANGKAVVCRNLKVSEVDKAISSSFGINGNVLVCGKIEEQSLLTITNGSIITITDEEFEKYKNGAYEVTFDATGGTVKTVTQTVYYGSKYGTLPTPTKEYYVFDGWYTDAESGEKITEDSVFNQSKNIILYAHWTPNPASDWVLEKDLPAGAKVEATKWTYDLVTRKKSNNSTMTGYIQYDSTWTWGEYGDWSGWQNSAVSGSDSRQVDTQWIAPTYKTQYYYSRWAQYSNNSGRFGPGQGTWSGVYCGYFFENGWRDDPLPYVSTRYSGQLGRDFTTWGDNGANAWYDQQTRQVQTGGGYTQYRYRDRSKIYTYYYMKTEAKESSTEVKESINTSAPSESITNVKKWVKYVNK